MSNDPTELKHCPFCGGNARERKTDIGPGYKTSQVGCTRCPAEVGKSGLDAKDFWNARSGELQMQWVKTDASLPKATDEHVDVSAPLLFETVDGWEDGRHVRLGYYDLHQQAFFESGDIRRLPWKQTVSQWFQFPLPADMEAA